MVTAAKGISGAVEIKVGSQQFILVDRDNNPETFTAGKDEVFANGKEIDSAKFLERFGLNPKIPFQRNSLVAYFSELNKLPIIPISANSYDFSWAESVCKNDLAKVCLPQTDDERIASLFANRAEQEAAGLHHTQRVSELLTKNGKLSMADKYKSGDEILSDAQNRLTVATSLLGKEHPHIKALQTELTHKQEAQQRVHDIIRNRINEITIGHIDLMNNDIYRHFDRSRGGQVEYPAETAAAYKEKITQNEAAQRASFQELAEKIAAFQKDFGDLEARRFDYVTQAINVRALQNPVTIVTKEGEVVATLAPLIAK